MSKNLFIRREAIPFLALGAGGVGLVLRVLLYLFGTDGRGLLPRYHWLHLLTLALTALVSLALILAVSRLDGSCMYRRNFPASNFAGFTNFSAALWLGWLTLSLADQAAELLDLIHTLAMALAAVSLAVCGWLRMRGKRPGFLLHGILCAAFSLHMVCRYRVWSADPQLPNYIFQIFACVCLSFTAYHRTAFDQGMGRRRPYLFFCLMSMYLCFLCLVGDGDLWYYLAGGIWAFGELCPMAAPRSKFQIKERE